ncbi:MAG: hypothetical protein NOM71_01390 [Archaeoglobi archaeon]|nr:hypothetical protein [Archaeoglobi archaeon]
MISSASAIVIAILYGLKTPFLAPAVFLARFMKKEVSVFLYFLYCVLLSYELSISDMLSIDEAAVAALLSAILLLDESLSERKRNFVDYSIFFLMPLGLLSPPFVILLLLIALLNILWVDRPGLGIAILLYGVIAVYSVTMLFRGMGSYRNPVTEVLVLSAICAFLILFSILLNFLKAKSGS